MTQYQVELALTQGVLYVRMLNGNLWKVRPNGATKTWKRNPDAFSIPFKVGLRTCGRITNMSEFSSDGDKIIIEWV